ncbi:MAG: hypothetical protein V4649_14135 [Bacteroidota bacterium]
MNFKRLLFAAAGVLFTLNTWSQEIPDHVVNHGPSFGASDNTFSPQGTNSIRQYNPDYSLNSINTPYGVIMSGNYNSALKTITLFESSTDDLRLYPNPVIGSARIELHEPAPVTAFVFIIDMNARVVRAWQYPAGALVLDVDMGGLALGMYSVRVFGPYISYHNLKVIKGQ